MKKLFLLLILTLNSLLLSAQSHFTFKGIPMDGHISTFVEKMKSKGYIVVKKAEDAYIMKGSFAGKDAKIFIISTPQTKTVCRVAVLIEPVEYTWESFKNLYLDFRHYYIEKYGSPSSDYNFFAFPYNEGEGKEMQAVEEDKCRYCCFFILEEGAISISISDLKAIEIVYEDNINIEKKKSESLSIIYDDI